jgi:nitroreductase
MELMDAIRTRRAVREYSDAPIEKPTIAALIDAAVQAPSAMNLQPWAFAVIQDRQQISRYAERAKEWLILRGRGPDEAASGILEQPGFTIFYNAPALVIVLATSEASQANQDCCLAAQNLMLAARDQGIGSCWIGFSRSWLDLASTKKELGLPETYHVVAPIVLGHPNSWPAPHGRKAAAIHWL